MVAGQKRRHADKLPAELANGNVNLKASVNERGIVTFAPLQTKPKWNIKFCLEDAAVSGVQYEPPNTISVDHEHTIRELVENIDGGIEHSFAIAEGPARPFSLRLGVQTDGISKIAEHDSNLCFWGNDGPVFVYQNLVVRDATGRQVKSSMSWANEGPHIILDVLETPVFPVLIDPLATIPGKALLPFKLPENLLSFLGPGAKVVDVTCSSTIANFADDSSDSDEDNHKPKKAHRKIELPAFSKLFPSFRLPTQWIRSLYGGSKSTASPLARGQNALLSHSSFPHLDIGLDWEGNVRFDAKSWFLTVSPPALDLESAELLHGPNLHVLRSSSAETGVSFYKDSAQHFFLLSKPLNKFELRFTLNGVAKIEFDSEHHYLTILEGDHPRLVYAAPLLRLPSGKTYVPHVAWNGSSFSVDLPSTSESFPLVIAFSIAGKRPSGPRTLARLFPHLKFKEENEVHDSATSSSSSGSSSGSDDDREHKPNRRKPAPDYPSSEEDLSDDEETRKRKGIHLPSISFKFPHLKKWTGFLYGKAPEITALPPGQPARLPHRSLNNISVDLLETGEIEYHAPDWKVKFSPNFTLPSPQLLRGKELQLLRGEDGETGLSFDAKHTRHFFVFNKAPATPKLLLRLEQLEGSTALEFDPNRGFVAFRNPDGRLFLVYSSPIAVLPSGETVEVPVEWDAESSGIAIQLPQEFPLSVIFGVTAEIPEESFAFIHPKFKRIVRSDSKSSSGDSGEDGDDQISVPTFSVPSFSAKLPNTELGPWLSTLYGDGGDANLTPVPSGKFVVEPHPSLNHLDVTLAPNGEVDFGNATYKVKLTPLGFTIADPKLYKRDGLQVVRGADVELGLSYDKNTTRHFFYFAKDAPSKLLLQLEQLTGSTKLEYNPEAEYVAFSDENDKLVLVYSSPVVRLPSGETVTLPVEWDGEQSAISVKLPEGPGPLVVTFGIAAKKPTSKLDFLSRLFPFLQFGDADKIAKEKREFEKAKPATKKPTYNHPPKSVPKVGGTTDKPKGKPITTGPSLVMPSFALKWPTFDLGRTWISNLYGTAEDPLKPSTEEKVHHVHPSLNKLDVSLSLNGDTLFSAPDWKAKFSPNFELTNPKLSTGSGVNVLRGDDGEIGLSFDKLSSRHFFFFGKQPPEKFLLSFASIEGGATKVEHNKEKASVAFFDAAGKVRLVYSAPTAKLSNNQTITLGLDWDPSTSSISVTLPELNSPPLVLAFAVGLKYTELKGEKSRPGSGRFTPTIAELKDKDEPKAIHGRSGSFSGVKYHTFKPDRSWLNEIYGSSDVKLTAKTGKLPKLPHAVLPNFDVNLGIDGSVEYGVGDWKFKLTPIFVPTPPVPHCGDGVHVLRGEDGEIGIFCDKLASRHFFIIGRPLATTKFGLKLTQVSGNTKVEFSKEKGFVAFVDSNTKYRLVYSSPRVQTGSGKSSSPIIDWDTPSSTISVNVPDLTVPILISFQLGISTAMGPKFRQVRPGSGTYEPIDPSKLKQQFGGGFSLPTFMLKAPNFKLSKPWHEALYGPSEVALTHITSRQPHPIPALNGLEVGLGTGGDVDYGAQDWKIKLGPVNFSLTAATLLKGDGLQIVRSDANEIGLSYDQSSLRHYFFFGKAPAAQKFSIKLTPLTGSVKVDLIPEKGVVTFSDHEGHLKFVYTSPVVLLPSGRTVPVNIDWQGPSNSLVVLLPEMAFPLVLAFGVAGKIPESKEKSRTLSFPSFRFGVAGDIELPVNADKGKEIEVPAKIERPTKVPAASKAKELGFSFKLPKATLPSFSLHFPKFKLGRSWTTTLYGPSGHALKPVPEGQRLRLTYPSLPHFEVGLAPNGEAHFDSADWKLSVTPEAFSITTPKLFEADGLQLLRGDDGEIGISFDASSSRHFFFLGKAPASTKFSIKLTQNGAKVEFSKDRGFLALIKGPVPLVYYEPVVLLPTGKTTKLPLEWDAQASTLSVILPDLAFPVIITFGVGTKIPDSTQRFGFSFPSLKRIRQHGEPDHDSSSSSSSSSSSDEEDEDAAQPAKVVFPVSYQKGVPSTQVAKNLYGTSSIPFTEVPAGQSATLKHPSLGLDLGLGPSGELEFASPTFKVKLTPNITLISPKLLKRDGLQVLRADDGEIGVSFDATGPSRHFFILPKAPTGGKLALALEVLAGGVQLKFDKHSTEVCDDKGKTQFVYLSPIAQYGGKTVTLPLEWDATASALVVSLPESATYPLLVAFTVSPKVIEGTSRWSVGFPALRGRLTRTGEVDDRPEVSQKASKKLVLPSFFSTFSPAKLVKWLATLYGPNVKADALIEVPEGQTSTKLDIPSLGLAVSLTEDGEVEFGSPSWTGKFYPEQSVRFTKLFSYEGLVLLRHSDGEIGLSYDKGSIRYFFIINSPTKTFQLNFEQIDGATKLQYFQEEGLLSFADDKDKVIFVISSPIVLSGDKTSKVLLTYNGAINIDLPATTKFPAIITFGISNVAPTAATKTGSFFPDIDLRDDGGEGDYDDDELEIVRGDDGEFSDDVQRHPGKFEFSERYPTFKLDAHWLKALYGLDLTSPTSNIPEGQASIFFYPSLGDLKVALNYYGEVTFQDVDWKLSLSAPSPITQNGTLIERDGLQVLRSDAGELGLAFDKKGAKFFIILGAPLPSPVISLHFKIDAGTTVEFAKDKGFVVFLDKSGKPKLVIAPPVGHIASNKDFTFPIEWDPKSNVINILLPHHDTVPFAFAFALHPTPPPEEKKGGLGGWIGSVLGRQPEEWVPAVPGIDAPVYEYPKAATPQTSAPTSSPPPSRPSPTPQSGSAQSTPARSSPPPVRASTPPGPTTPSTPSTSSPSPATPTRTTPAAQTPAAQKPAASPKSGPKSSTDPSGSYSVPQDTAGTFSDGAKPQPAHPSQSPPTPKATTEKPPAQSHDATKSQEDAGRAPSRPTTKDTAPPQPHKATTKGSPPPQPKEATSKDTAGPSETALEPQSDTKGTFSVGPTWEVDPTSVSQHADTPLQDAIDIKNQTATPTPRTEIRVSTPDLSSSSSSSSSESDGEGNRRKKQKEKKTDKKEPGKQKLEPAVKPGAEKKPEKKEHQKGQDPAQTKKDNKPSKPTITKEEQVANEKAVKLRRAADLAKLGPLPSAEFDRGFRGALYGKVELDNFLHEAPATTLYSATTNLTFEITAHDGVLSIGPSQGNAWLVRVVPVGLAWNAEHARLFKGVNFVSVRSEGIEIGAQVREDSSSQFFVLAKGGPLVLRFETNGIGEVKYDPKDGETLFSDTKGNPLFIYSTPALHAHSKSKKVNSNITWDGHKKELRIEAVGYTNSLGIVCAICTKCITLPPDDVLYSLDDGSFVVVHPKVNFMGHASGAGISYRSLNPEVDPWSINFSLQGGRVHKAYAQSKCTVVLLRTDGIREYLAYVDRGGEYVGLHQSFHLHNRPASFPLRVSIALTLDNITEIEQNSDSLITFSTKSGPVFAYGNLVVLDARGNSLASQIRLEEAESERPRIVLEVLEEGEFPLVVG